MRNIDGLPLIHALTGNQILNLGMCTHWGLIPQPFGVWYIRLTLMALSQARKAK